MKNIKLYNAIFPLWVIFYIPPILFFALVGNFLIDGTVIWITLLINKVKLEKNRLLVKIIQAWCCGFAIDFLGTSIIGIISIKVEIISVYNPWETFISALIYISIVLICGVAISLINYRLFKKDIIDKKIRLILGILMGIITAPWTFLIPTTWFIK